jgi:putative transposase
VTYARKSLVSLTDTPYYHVVARCVRRAWLWGYDEYAKRDYSHRKAWVLERLGVLSRIFAIDICAYAVMANHYHLVVHVNRSAATSWSNVEVAARWGALFNVPPLVEEGRFKSQALLDEAGLLTAMAYVDLNPIRSGIAATPENSEFTSIYERIHTFVARSERAPIATRNPRVPLRAFRTSGQTDNTIPYRLEDYLELVDWTGRAVRADKRGSIHAGLPPILGRLAIDAEAWQLAMRPRGNVFGRAIGSLNYLRLHAKTLGQSWVRGLHQARQLYFR